jgi:hypothetical protein
MLALVAPVSVHISENAANALMPLNVSGRGASVFKPLFNDDEALRSCGRGFQDQRHRSCDVK